MAIRTMSLSRLGLVYSTLLDAADTLIAEFPDAPAAVVYDSVGAARQVADKSLPDLAAFKWAIEREARVTLTKIGTAGERSTRPVQPTELLSSGTV